MKQLKDGQVENVTHKRCGQTQCEFYLRGGCRPCDDCGAHPYEINKSCDRCYNCENVPDALRWGKNNVVQIKSKEENKTMEVMH